MLVLPLVVFLTAAAGASGAEPGCVAQADRATFCENGTVWSAGPCEGGEYLVCESTAELPNITTTALLALTSFGIAIPPLILAAAVAALGIAAASFAKSFDTTLPSTDAERYKILALVLTTGGVLGTGVAASILAVGIMSGWWLWMQGLEVVEKADGHGQGKRVTLFATTGLGRSSPLASYTTERGRDCHDEIVRLAAEDHFFKVAEMWTMRNRSLISPLDPWKALPRLPDRTPQHARMTVQKCQAQLEGGVARVKRAQEETARAREETKRSDEKAREDLRQCAMKTSTCTCNCDSRGGAGGAGGSGGVVSLGEKGTPADLMAKLSEALGPDVKVAERDGAIQVPLKETVLFEWDKDVLTPVARATLGKAAKVFVANPEALVVVEGHTSAPGATDYNMDLSARRVKAVVEALVSMGVARNRISTAAFGESRPDVATGTEEARNRRVIIRLK